MIGLSGEVLTVTAFGMKMGSSISSKQPACYRESGLPLSLKDIRGQLSLMDESS